MILVLLIYVFCGDSFFGCFEVGRNKVDVMVKFVVNMGVVLEKFKSFYK